jgi:hypothetical protein
VARLAEERGLLVACDAGHREAPRQSVASRRRRRSARGNDARKHGPRHVEQRQQLVIPVERVDVEKQRARRIRDIRHVGAPAGKMPDEPGIDGAERELAAFGALASAGDVVEQPRELRAREVGVQQEARALSEKRFVAGLSQSVTSGRGASVLPNDRVGDRAPRGPLPQHGRFALVGDADRADILRGKPGSAERPGGDVALGMPDFQRVVLHPARLRVDLAEFLLGASEDPPVPAEGDGAGARGPLVEGENGLHG